tara:strand:+ start:53 stop:271 length:219 start_codon:yes stop_codon:yes gene_type:complete
MAERVNDYEFPVRYDWSAWFNGETWILRSGEDFAVRPEIFRSQAYRAATTRGGTLLTSREGDDVVLRFTPRK